MDEMKSCRVCGVQSRRAAAEEGELCSECAANSASPFGTPAPIEIKLTRNSFAIGGSLTAEQVARRYQHGCVITVQRPGAIIESIDSEFREGRSRTGLPTGVELIGVTASIRLFAPNGAHGRFECDLTTEEFELYRKLGEMISERALKAIKETT